LRCWLAQRIHSGWRCAEYPDRVAVRGGSRPGGRARRIQSRARLDSSAGSSLRGQPWKMLTAQVSRI
jgi:hypothetical protein